MYARSGTLFISFTALCIQELNQLQLRKELEFKLPSTKTRWGFEEGFLPLRARRNGDFTLVIPVSEQVETESRLCISKSLSRLTTLLNVFVTGEARQQREHIKKNQFQLFSVETYSNPGYHGSCIILSISPEAAWLLDKHSQTAIPGVHRAMREHNCAKFPEDKKRDPIFLRMDLQGVIREHGTVSFKTPGNCACLGEAPEPTQEGRGKYATSHNLDSPWQQLSMLVGIATMWRWVRTELDYK